MHCRATYETIRDPRFGVDDLKRFTMPLEYLSKWLTLQLELAMFWLITYEYGPLSACENDEESEDDEESEGGESKGGEEGKEDEEVISDFPVSSVDLGMNYSIPCCPEGLDVYVSSKTREEFWEEEVLSMDIHLRGVKDSLYASLSKGLIGWNWVIARDAFSVNRRGGSQFG